MIQKKIADAILAKKKFVKVTVVEKIGSGPAEVGKTMLVFTDGNFWGTIGGGTLEKLAQLKAQKVIKKEKSTLRAYNLDKNDHVSKKEIATNMACGGKVKLFYEFFSSQPTFYIFGAGHIGIKLAEMLKIMDLVPKVIDIREEFTQNSEDAIHIKNYADFFQKNKIPTGSYVIIATHSHELDYIVLKELLQNTDSLKYIGLVASKQKTATMLQKLEEDLGKLPDLSSLYMPVGLNIGGRMPAEIALSILAEIQSIRYRKDEIKHLRRIEV